MTENNNNSGANRRRHVRTQLRTRLKLMHPSVGEIIVHSGDLSDGGLYVISDGQELPSMGEIVQVQVQDLPVEAPLVKAKIVRVDPAGVGLEFLS